MNNVYVGLQKWELLGYGQNHHSKTKGLVQLEGMSVFIPYPNGVTDIHLYK